MHKNFVKIWLTLTLIGVCLMFILTTIVDPVGVMGIPIIKGVNNNKVKQYSYLDVFKPYEVKRVKPDVIFIGSSRVYYGLKPSVPESNVTKVYNLGFSMLSLDHMEKYLEYVYKLYTPKRILLGLDFFQFGVDNFNNRTRGFSQARLDLLAKDDLYAKVFFPLKENFQVNSATFRTLFGSLKKRKEVNVFENGWYKEMGSSDKVDARGYYKAVNKYNEFYNDWKYANGSLECLERIIDSARKKGIEIIAFWNPVCAEMQLSLYLRNRSDEMDRLKERVARISGKLYDFNYINSATLDRVNLFYDGTHYNSKLGDIIKKDIWNEKDTETMMVLTAENATEQLGLQRKYIEDYMSENEEYIDVYKEKIYSGVVIEKGDLKKFIGF